MLTVDLPSLSKRAKILKEKNDQLEREYNEICSKRETRRKAKAAEVLELEVLNRRLKAKVEAMKILDSDEDSD